MTAKSFLVALVLGGITSLALPARAATPVTFSTAMDAYRSGDFEKSFTQLQQLAEGWDARAQLLLGLAMVGGVHVPKESAKGVAWVLMAASGVGYGGSARDEAREMKEKLWAKSDGPARAAAQAEAENIWRAHETRRAELSDQARRALLDPAASVGREIVSGCAEDPALPMCVAAAHRGLPAQRCQGVSGTADVPVTSRGADVRIIKPDYPESMRRSGWEGLVVVALHIDRSGYVCRAVLLESTGHDVVDHSVLDAVRAWHLVPAQQARQPVEAIYITGIDMLLTSADKWRATHDAYLELSRAALGE